METEKYMKARDIMNYFQLFYKIERMREILNTTTDKNETWRKMYEEELQYHLDCIAQDPAVVKLYEQWKLTVGADDRPEEVISNDIQEANRQLIDLIAQIQNAEPAPHRQTLEDGYYIDKGMNETVFIHYHLKEIFEMIDLCQQAYNIQESINRDDLKFIPVLSIKKLKDKYKDIFVWNEVLCDSIGVFVKI